MATAPTPEQGPAQTVQHDFRVPVSYAGGLLKLALSVNLPREASTPLKTVLFFNGFQMRGAFYQGFAQSGASWGYAWVRYTLPLFKVVVDSVELRFMPRVLAFLKHQNESPGSPLRGRLDLGNLAVMGHSRGAKLATLHYTGDPSIRAAYLIDPVDNTSATPEGRDYPSAVRALRGSGRPVGLVGAGIVGSCNPEGANYKEFWGAAGRGSWQTVVLESGHLDFEDGGALVNCLFGWLCKHGRNSHEETLRLTLPGMLAYLRLHMPSYLNSGSLEDFHSFVERERAAGALTFAEKDKGGGGAGEAGQEAVQAGLQQ